MNRYASAAAAVAVIALLTPWVAPPARADVRPARLFSDHLVLQQGVPVPVWGTADAGEQVTVSIAGQKQTGAAGPDGKWLVKLDALPAGGPHELTIAGKNAVRVADVLVGEVWLCSGQSNMDMRLAKTKERYWSGVDNEAEEIAAANYPQIRQFVADVKLADEPQADVRGEWKLTTPQNAGEFSATAHFFGRELHREIKVPVGLLVCSFGASTAQAWISREALAAQPQLAPMLEEYAKACSEFEGGAARAKYEQAIKEWETAAEKAKADGGRAPRKPREPKDPRKDQHNPCVLYNGMIAPVVPYAVRGVIWYQGESNGYNVEQYLPLMTTLIADWRQRWQQPGQPFLFAQLAAHGKPDRDQIARVREAQLQTLAAAPHTAMAVTIDIGDAANVHPKNKQEVGKRLALAAQALCYGKPVPYSGPVYQSMAVEGDRVRLRFAHADGGLKAKDGGKLVGFAVAGDDGKFVPADATIDGEAVLVAAPQVPQPKHVRYAFADFPEVSLYNGAGLPASPFRTDAPPARQAPEVTK